jgi:hypothetical protein
VPHVSSQPFANRAEAGGLLAAQFVELADRDDVIVLGLPRGGVPVAYEVARSLRVPLDVFVVRKLGVPGHEELAMGAIASGGVRLLNHDVVDALGIPGTVIDQVAARLSRDAAAPLVDRQNRHARRRWAGDGIDDAGGGYRDTPAAARADCCCGSGRRARHVQRAGSGGRSRGLPAQPGTVHCCWTLVPRFHANPRR